ncbi:MAG TPA: ABC transporter permease, partial [Gemmatimonadota bacterium]|nr:ABC transporter permease [Gemmatimonadota bacterium]
MLEGLPPGVRRLLRLPRELRRQVVDDVDAEIRFHLDSRVDELMAGGMEREAAERRAREEFGDVQEARRALGARTARTERRRRRLVWLRQLGTDLRYGWRKLRARPGFAVTAILTFALGIGATTAIFSVMYAVLLRPLPYPRSDRLVQLWDVHPGGDDHNVVSSGNYLAWRDRADSFRDLGAYGQNFGLGLVGKTGEPVHVVATTITPSTFRILGASAAAGRIFTAREGRPDGGAVALLSYRLWQTRFGGDTAVIGRSVDLNDAERTIVGVMPPTFAFPNPRVDVWLPRAFGARDRSTHDSHQWRVIGRLRDGVTLRKARAEIRVITDQLRRRYPEAMEGWGVNVVPFRSDLVAGVRPLLLALFAMVVLVLLITCANLANLLLARALGREREVAVRAALGAGRVRLVRQFLTESLVVSLLGSALGVGVVALALPGLLTLIPPDIPLLTRVRIDPVVLAFSTAVTMGATLLFGLVPALRVTAADPAGALGTRGGGRAGPGGSR